MKVHFVEVDLADMATIRRAVDEIKVVTDFAVASMRVLRLCDIARNPDLMRPQTCRVKTCGSSSWSILLGPCLLSVHHAYAQFIDVPQLTVQIRMWHRLHSPQEHLKSVDGLDLGYAVNFVGPVLLMQMLKPLLLDNAPSTGSCDSGPTAVYSDHERAICVPRAKMLQRSDTPYLEMLSHQ